VQQGMEFCSACGMNVSGASPPPTSPQYPQQQAPQQQSAPQPYPSQPNPQQPYPPQPYPQQPYPPQPYPYQYPPAQPYAPPKDDASSVGKVIAIVLVLLVVFVVIGAVIFYLFVASVEDLVDDLPDATTVTVRSPELSSRLINGTWYWDATIVIGSVTPSATDVPWRDVTVALRAGTGPTLLAPTMPRVNSPQSYDDAADGTVDVEVWYADADRDGDLTTGDTLYLTGLTTEAQMGELELWWDLSVIGSCALPTNFP